MKLYLEDIEGIPAVKILKDSESAPNGYIDSSTDLLSWKNYGHYDSSDYLQLRMYVQESLNNKGWTNLNAEERDYIITLHLDDENLDDQTNAVNKITHILTTGKANSQGAARTILVKAWAAHHIKERESSKKRLNSEKVYEVVGNYLSTNDGADFFVSIGQLFAGFSEQAIKGTNDGVDTLGLFDYIESSVGTVYENSGLASKGYTMQNGDANSDNFVVELMDVLRKGNYES